MKGKELFILTVCGVGMGSSLVLRMYVEDVLREMGLKARGRGHRGLDGRGGGG